jgi:hypothetical protein
VRRLLLALCLALPAAGSAFPVEVLVRPAEGREVRGRLTGLSSKVLRVYAGTGAREFKLAELMSAEFPRNKPPDASGCARLLTTSGDVIPAKVSAGAGKLSASGPWTERFDIGTKDLSGVLMPAGLKDKRAREALSGRLRPKKDHLYLPGDDFEGSFEGLTSRGVKFKSFLGEVEYELTKIAAVSFAELKPFSFPDKTYYVAELAGGGRVAGTPTGLSGGSLRWKTLGGMKLGLKVAAVSAIRVLNGKVIFLSDLNPVKVEQKPFIQGLPFIWTWRRDTDVFCKPLSLGGRKYVRGLGVAAYTKLTFRLDGKYKRFKAEAGICDSVARGGKTAFKVLLDGKEKFNNQKNPSSRGSSPRRVDVDVTGGKLLHLVMDFGPDGSDLGDIGGWGEARLVK